MGESEPKLALECDARQNTRTTIVCRWGEDGRRVVNLGGTLHVTEIVDEPELGGKFGVRRGCERCLGGKFDEFL